MDLRERRERRFRRMSGRAQVLVAIAAMVPRNVYSELLGYTLPKKPDKPDKAMWWAKFMFRDIYGVLPRDEDLGEPKEPSGVLLEWILTMRPKPPKKPRKNSELCP